jgi:hypothetical protein
LFFYGGTYHHFSKKNNTGFGVGYLGYIFITGIMKKLKV